MTITRGKMQRNLYNQGGIINAVPREGYFLGKLAKSVKKGVKKIGKGVKKFAKSDLGKAAMLAAGAYFMPGIGIKAQGGLGSFLGSMGSKASSAGNFLRDKGISFLNKPRLDMVLDSSGENYIPKRLANKAFDSGLSRFEVGSGYFGEDRKRNDGGIKTVLADFFQDEKKRNILSDVLKGATSAYGGKLAYDDQKRINEARQRDYDDYVSRRAAVSSQLEDVVPELDIKMANGGRVNRAGGGMMMASADMDIPIQDLAYGGKIAYDDQKRINEARKRDYDNYVSRRAAVSSQLEDVVPELDIKMANGGRVNYYEGGMSMSSMSEDEMKFMRLVGEFMEQGFTQEEAIEAARDELARKTMAVGGIMDLDIRTNPQGTQEIDYRENGGFVPPIGIKEKADDIPAMLSNNEFVMTADSVRGIGNGSVKNGAKKLYSIMKEAEGRGRA